MASFNTVLINRKANERPRDWELQLRTLSNKLRVVEKLSGAHLLVSGVPSLAVRIYHVDDINRLENEVVKSLRIAYAYFSCHPVNISVIS